MSGEPTIVKTISPLTTVVNGKNDRGMYQEWYRTSGDAIGRGRRVKYGEEEEDGSRSGT